MPAVPNSAGVDAPQLRVPSGACDCHMHIFDPARPSPPGAVGLVADQSTAADYRLLQRRLGTQRAVVVTPRYYGTDNKGTIDAIRTLGPDRTRGIAVVDPHITDRELISLRDAGIRGVRYSFFQREDVPIDSPRFGQLAAIAPRLEQLGMHAQLHWSVDQIVAHAQLLQTLPCTVVIDHLGRLPQGVGMAHPAYDVLRRRLDGGRTWIKLSGWYLDSAGAPYSDAGTLAATFVRAAPDRVVWGSDWPHPTETQKPDDAALLDMLLSCVPDASLRERILVDNPATLYAFDPQ